MVSAHFNLTQHCDIPRADLSISHLHNYTSASCSEAGTTVAYLSVDASGTQWDGEYFICRAAGGLGCIR